MCRVLLRDETVTCYWNSCLRIRIWHLCICTVCYNAPRHIRLERSKSYFGRIYTQLRRKLFFWVYGVQDISSLIIYCERQCVILKDDIVLDEWMVENKLDHLVVVDISCLSRVVLNECCPIKIMYMAFVKFCFVWLYFVTHSQFLS